MAGLGIRNWRLTARHVLILATPVLFMAGACGEKKNEKPRQTPGGVIPTGPSAVQPGLSALPPAPLQSGVVAANCTAPGLPTATGTATTAVDVLATPTAASCPLGQYQIVPFPPHMAGRINEQAQFVFTPQAAPQFQGRKIAVGITTGSIPAGATVLADISGNAFPTSGLGTGGGILAPTTATGQPTGKLSVSLFAQAPTKGQFQVFVRDHTACSVLHQNEVECQNTQVIIRNDKYADWVPHGGGFNWQIVDTKGTPLEQIPVANWTNALACGISAVGQIAGIQGAGDFGYLGGTVAQIASGDYSQTVGCPGRR